MKMEEEGFLKNHFLSLLSRIILSSAFMFESSFLGIYVTQVIAYLISLGNY